MISSFPCIGESFDGNRREEFHMAQQLIDPKQIYIIHRTRPAGYQMPSLVASNTYYTLNYHIRGDRITITPKATYTAKPGDISALAPYLYHRTFPASEDIYENIHIKFSAAFVKRLTDAFGEQLLTSIFDHPANRFDTETRNLIRTMVYEMLHIYNNPTAYSSFILENMLSQLLLMILEKRLPDDANASLHPTPLTPPIIEAVCYIEKHFSEDIKIEKAANISGYSVSHFSKLFSAQIGKSFSEYLSFVRLRKAQHLLLNTSMSVTDIAIETGYQYPGNMTAAFKRLTGFTPHKFRLINAAAKK